MGAFSRIPRLDGGTVNGREMKRIMEKNFSGIKGVLLAGRVGCLPTVVV